MENNSKVRFIDLFAGIGGMRIAFESVGMECVFSSEWDQHAQEIYRLNFGELPHGDITQIDASEVPDHEVLVAGFPCQPFSISGKKAGFEDTRGTLFFDILRIIQEKQTPVVILENVKFLRHHDGGRTLSVITSSLESIGYKVAWKILNAADFGVPQNRERIVIVAAKSSKFNFELLRKRKRQSISSVLEVSGEFQYLEPEEYTILPKRLWKQQDSGLIFVGYRNKSERTVGVRPGTSHLSRVHKQPNRIYHIQGTHPTLPSQETSGRFWIYDGEMVRKLTLREAFRLMGFPDSFALSGTPGQLYLRCGNSVAVPLFAEVARAIESFYFSGTENISDELFQVA